MSDCQCLKPKEQIQTHKYGTEVPETKLNNLFKIINETKIHTSNHQLRNVLDY